jgi:hypothetical protein
VDFSASQLVAGHGSGERTSRPANGAWPALRLRRDLDCYLGRTAGERPRRSVCYCRVSSPAQHPDFKNQWRIVEEFALAKDMANLEFILGFELVQHLCPKHGV